jgi:hypothetical protein
MEGNKREGLQENRQQHCPTPQLPCLFTLRSIDRDFATWQLPLARKWLLCLSFDLHTNACRWVPPRFLVCMAFFQYCQNQDAAYGCGSGYVQRGSSHTHKDGVHVLLLHSGLSPPLVAPQMRDNEIHRNHLPSTRRLNRLSCVWSSLISQNHSLTTWGAASIRCFLEF